MIAYTFDPDEKVIHVRASGVLVASDPINYFEKIDNDTSFIGKAEERIYFTELEDIKVSFTDIADIKEAFSRFGHGEKITNGVFIVDSDLSFGMARMIISTFDEIYNHFEVKRVG